MGEGIGELRKAIFLIALALVILKAFELVEVAEINTNSTLNGLDFNGKVLALIQGSCVQFWTKEGVMLNETCFDATVNSADHYNNTFAFVTSGGSVYITDEKGTILHNFTVPIKFDNTIMMYKDKLLLCGYGCALYTSGGKMIWKVSVSHLIGSPSKYDDVLYVPSVITEKVYVANLTNGKRLNTIYIGDVVYSAKTCNRNLFIVGAKEIYLFNLTNPTDPEYLWDMRAGDLIEEVAISPKCNYLAAIDVAHNSINILTLDGTMIMQRLFTSQPVGIAWGNEIYVALSDGKVLIFKLVR